jgi:hypothetical protein
MLFPQTHFVVSDLALPENPPPSPPYTIVAPSGIWTRQYSSSNIYIFSLLALFQLSIILKIIEFLFKIQKEPMSTMETNRNNKNRRKRERCLRGKNKIN